MVENEVVILPDSDPVLSSEATGLLEKRLFADNEAKEWVAMQRAGRAVAKAVLDDFQEIGGFPRDGLLLVLVGKGHNGADACLAALAILEKFPEARAEVLFVFGSRPLRPLARRAWQRLAHAAAKRVRQITSRKLTSEDQAYALCLDGVFGFQFRPPLPPIVAELFAAVDQRSIGLRAAVDLPSGLSEAGNRNEGVFRADFTYATGSVKLPLANGSNAGKVGRLRYLDLGFFAQEKVESRLHVLRPAVLAPLAKLRSPESDKRTYGHVFLVGGSRGFPGAILMSVLSALRSGAGLVTAFVPESLVPAYAAEAPEAMWVGWPETPAGGLALEGEHLLQSRLKQANALVIGPGLGREAETQALVKAIVTTATVPLVIDADALQPEIVRAGTAPRILTPHLGELRRILQGDDFYQTSIAKKSIIVVKGRLTCVTQSGRAGYYSLFGGPVLARGGSGDLLAGMTGRMLAETPTQPLLAASRAVVWHGMAADRLARAHGQVAVRTTQLLDFLPDVLRGLGNE
jgi:ADP-dependent NAD(P)H-hydrate dehydratase / NAD(P)H-hydrate epimerase